MTRTMNHSIAAILAFVTAYALWLPTVSTPVAHAAVGTSAIIAPADLA